MKYKMRECEATSYTLSCTTEQLLTCCKPVTHFKIHIVLMPSPLDEGAGNGLFQCCWVIKNVQFFSQNWIQRGEGSASDSNSCP